MQVWSRSGCEVGSKEEPALKVILSALWNLSAHCRKNKVSQPYNYLSTLENKIKSRLKELCHLTVIP